MLGGAVEAFPPFEHGKTLEEVLGWRSSDATVLKSSPF
jgi:hypothetical protein